MCIFCQIIAGKLPSYQIYEDDKSLAFLDIKPSNPGHILIIPKKHSASIEDISEADLSHLSKIIKKIGARVKEVLDCQAYNIVLNNGVLAGQEILHLHFHIIPRYQNDGLKCFTSGKYQSGEIEDLQAKLKF